MPTPCPDVEPLLAGTLALMSAFHAAAPCPHIQRKIAANLERIAAYPLLSAEFRTIVGRLAAQWVQRDAEAACVVHPLLAPASAQLH